MVPKIPEVYLHSIARSVLKRLKKHDASVEIILLNGRELGRLKAHFGLKKQGKKPDVLAFSEPANFPHPDKKGRKFLGEIYLNKDLSAEQLNFLLIHGLLHLLGYTHEKKGDTLEMEKLEKKLSETFFLK